MKLFLKTFGIVFLAELLLHMLLLVIEQSSSNSAIRFACHTLTHILSVPWILIDRTYPYYAIEPGWYIAIMVITTLLLHSVAVYLVYKSVKKQPVK